tara:strand:- start:2229 stop:4004 length:1776 start_codon:yes stop_codon:yes gene_type:complete
MGRVLPSLTTRSGVVGLADAVGANKDQQLRTALRRAAFQKAEERKTPEGMLKFIGQAAQTAGQVTSAVKGIGGLIGSLPLSDAMRSAAAAKATREMVTPEARQMFQQTVEQTGVGQGAPVMADQFDGSPGIARAIQSLSQQGPQGRIAAAALKQQAEEDMQMRSLRDRSAAADVEVGEVAESLLPDEPGEKDLAPDDTRQQFMEATTQAEEMVDSQAQPQQRIAEQETVDVLSDVAPMSDADVEQVRTEQVAQALGSSPRERQSNLLRLASSAFSSEDQARVLRASEMIDIEPTQVSDLFAPRQAFRRKLLKAFPSAAQQLSARKAASTDARAAARLESAADRLAQQRQIETERQEMAKDKEKRLKEGQEADDKRADEALNLAMDKHRLAIDKDVRDRREWAYDFEFKQKKHEDMQVNQRKTRQLRRDLARKAGERASRREQNGNARNVNQAIRDETKAVNRLAGELTGHLKRAQNQVEQIKSDKARYIQKINLKDSRAKRAYARQVLAKNKGKDPVIVGYNKRLQTAEGDVANLKLKRKNTADAQRRIKALNTQARKFGGLMNFMDAARILDSLGKAQELTDSEIFSVDE